MQGTLLCRNMVILLNAFLQLCKHTSGHEISTCIQDEPTQCSSSLVYYVGGEKRPIIHCLCMQLFFRAFPYNFKFHVVIKCKTCMFRQNIQRCQHRDYYPSLAFLVVQHMNDRQQHFVAYLHKKASLPLYLCQLRNSQVLGFKGHFNSHQTVQADIVHPASRWKYMTAAEIQLLKDLCQHALLCTV